MCKLIVLVLVAAAGLLGQPAVNVQKAGMDAGRLARIPVRMKAFVDKGAVAGTVTLVQRRGALASLEATGYQDLETRKPMRTDSIFQIMSMTKPVTAVAVMILMEEGRLALGDPVEKHLPEFRGQKVIESRDGDRMTIKQVSRPITIRDLLTHTSGLPNRPPPGMAELLYEMNHTLAEAVFVYSQLPLEFEPGTQWRYSNPGIATLGRIVEVLADQPFEQFLEERIFKPLGMKDSFIFPPAGKLDRIAMVYRTVNGKLQKAGGDILAGDPAMFRKGAKYSGPEFGMYSTALDLAAFYQAMLNGGTHNGARILSRQSVDLMTSLHTGDIKAGHLSGTGFGLGWEVVKDPFGTLMLMSRGTFGHGGAFGTHGYVDREKEMVCVFLVQHASGGAADARNAFMAMAASAGE